MRKFLLITILSIKSVLAQDVSGLNENIFFVGQVFSSGNAYFISFSDKPVWPDKLMFKALKYQTDDIFAQKDSVIPSCSEASYFYMKEKDVAKVDFFKDELFSTILDECVDEEVGKYLFKEKITEPYTVIAFRSDVKLKNYTTENTGKLRPVDVSEMQGLKDAKIQALKSQANDDCTTEIQFIDRANILIEFDMQAAGTNGRLSYYFDPGCAGHLVNIYILDIFKDGKLIRTFKAFHYEGAL